MIKYVKTAMRTHADSFVKSHWNKLDTATYRQAAAQAVDEFIPETDRKQADLFDAPTNTEKTKQRDLFADIGKKVNLNVAGNAAKDSTTKTMPEPMRQASTFDEARAAAKAFQGKPLINRATGMTASVSRNNLDKMLNSKAVSKSVSPQVHSTAVANIDHLFTQAVLEETHPDRAKDPSLVAIHRFFSPMSYRDSLLNVKLTVKEFMHESNKIYSVEAMQIENATASVDPTESVGVGEQLSSLRPPSSSVDLTITQPSDDSNANAAHEDTITINEEKAPPAVKLAATAKITDFGEKIGGARKDAFSAFKGDLSLVSDKDIASEPFSKTWPVPNYQKLLTEGADPSTLAIVRSLREAIPTKPRTYRVRWAESVKVIRKIAQDLLSAPTTGSGTSVEETRRVLQTKAEESALYSKVLGRAELYSALGHAHSLAGFHLERSVYSYANGKQYDPPKMLWAITEDAKGAQYARNPKTIALGENKSDVIDRLKALLDTEANEAANKTKTKKAPALSIFRMRNDNTIWVCTKHAPHTKLAGPFASIKEAGNHIKENQEALAITLDRIKEVPRERRLTNNPRIGDDLRGGADVSAEMFSQAFGFRRVEFGNYVENARRQADLNQAYDALMDMAAIIGVPSKAISLNGELGLAFGARGHGGKNPASAHYESDKVVINLTKSGGAGSIGHEWWHAVDNYFARLSHKKDGFMSEEPGVVWKTAGVVENVRPEVVEAFSGLIDAIRATDLRERSAQLDTFRSKPYWRTNTEMTARVYESYLLSKLEEKNASNDYLANIIGEKDWENVAGAEKGYPYPLRAELPTINAAFDKFFSTLKTKETDKGTAIYSAKEGGALPESEWLSTGEIMEVVEKLIKPFKATQIPIRIIDSAGEAITGSANDGVVSGFVFNERIHIVREGVADSVAVARTLWHEMLHFGLRRFMTKEQYIPAMQKLYDNDAWIKAKAEAWIASDTDDVKQAKVSGMAYARARGVDEALANLAETLQSDSSGFDKNDAVNRALRAVYDWVSKLADRFGFHAAAKEWRGYAAQKDARDLVASVFSRLKEGAPPSVQSTEWQHADPAFSRKVTGQEASAKVRGTIQALQGLRRTRGSDQVKAVRNEIVGKSLRNLDSGIVATVSGESFGKMLSASNVTRSVSPQAHMQALGNLDTLFRYAIKTEERIGKKVGDSEIINAIHHFAVPMPLDGETLLVKMMAKEFKSEEQGVRIYLVSAIDIERAGVVGQDPVVSGKLRFGDSVESTDSSPPPSTQSRLEGKVASVNAETVTPVSKKGESLSEDSRSPHLPTGVTERFAQLLDAVNKATADKNTLRPGLESPSAKKPLPEKLTIDGVERPTTNSNGKPIAQTEEGVRNFWKWFGDSKVVDDHGKPLVMYHGTSVSNNGVGFKIIEGGYGSGLLYGSGAYFTERPLRNLYPT